MYKSNKNVRCDARPMEYQSQSSYQYVSDNMSSPNMNMSQMGAPIYECPQERVCHKEFVHEVKHICPINTRVINHHVYRHTYSPCYTCCEENVVCNVYDNCCNNF